MLPNFPFSKENVFVRGIGFVNSFSPNNRTFWSAQNARAAVIGKIPLSQSNQNKRSRSIFKKVQTPDVPKKVAFELNEAFDVLGLAHSFSSVSQSLVSLWIDQKSLYTHTKKNSFFSHLLLTFPSFFVNLFRFEGIYFVVCLHVKAVALRAVLQTRRGLSMQSFRPL